MSTNFDAKEAREEICRRLGCPLLANQFEHTLEIFLREVHFTGYVKGIADGITGKFETPKL